MIALAFPLLAGGKVWTCAYRKLRSVNGELWGAAAGSLLTLLAAVVALPKVRAEARKANAQAHQIEWATLNDEIGRQSRQIVDLRKELHALKNAVAVREAELLQENKALREEVVELRHENKLLRANASRLQIRVAGLEDVLKVRSTPDDMTELLAAIDEAERNAAKKS